MTGADVFTAHDLFACYLLGIAVGLLAGGLAVAALLSSLGRRIDQATTLPAPDVADVTERVTDQPIDLPRRGTHFEEYA